MAVLNKGGLQCGPHTFHFFSSCNNTHLLTNGLCWLSQIHSQFLPTHTCHYYLYNSYKQTFTISPSLELHYIVPFYSFSSANLEITSSLLSLSKKSIKSFQSFIALSLIKQFGHSASSVILTIPLWIWECFSILVHTGTWLQLPCIKVIIHKSFLIVCP